MNDGRMLVRDPDGQSIEEESTEKTESKKLDKTFKMGKKEYDLSKLQGGLTNEEYDALSNVERSRLNSRLRVYRNQNKEEWHDSIKGNANNIVSTNGVSNKASSVSSSASYEEGSGKEVVIINPKNNPSTTSQSTEEGKVVAIESGSGSGGSDSTASLYRG